MNTEKLTTAADVFTFKEKEPKKNKIPILVNAILELIHRGNKNLVPVRKDSKFILKLHKVFKSLNGEKKTDFIFKRSVLGHYKAIN